MNVNTLFTNRKPLIACIHLLSLPGSPGYGGSMKKIIEIAVQEADIFRKFELDGLIIENFRDNPFYPNKLPAETIASMAVTAHEIVKVFHGPVGVNALRNDAGAALAIATATGADFIRVNIHIGAAVTDQGIIEGKANETLRLRKMLNDRILIFADVAVKHASVLGNRTIIDEAKDLSTRGMADAIIVTGNQTGVQAIPEDIRKVKESTTLPVIIGSGITENNFKEYYGLADGFIVGSYFKIDGKANNLVDGKRVKKLTKVLQSLKQQK